MGVDIATFATVAWEKLTGFVTIFAPAAPRRTLKIRKKKAVAIVKN
jgi:hypothetical protein